MKRLARYVATIAATALMSGSAFAAIDFSDDFESYNLADGGVIGGGWKVFANIFDDYPGCSQYLYGYGPFDAPNGGGGFSSIVVGATNQALNAYSNYDDSQHASSNCVETSLFQEIGSFDAADAGTYVFSFDTQVPGALEGSASVFAFVKLLDPITFADAFGGAMVFDTTAAGPGSIEVTLTEGDAGKILQWGFSTKASNYEFTGRWYDNVSFAEKVVVPPPTGPYDGVEGVPIPGWALVILMGLLGWLGMTRLRNSHKA